MSISQIKVVKTDINCKELIQLLFKMSFCIEYAKRGTAGCKKCKQKIEKEVLRIGKVVPNPFTDSGGDMKQWFHVDCIFEQLSRARATTKKIEDPGDLEGWEMIEPEDRKKIMEHIKNSGSKTPGTTKKAAGTRKSPGTPKTPKGKNKKNDEVQIKTKSSPVKTDLNDISFEQSSPISDVGKDNDFREFRRICANLSDVSSYLEKTELLRKFFSKGTSGQGFKGDLHLWVKLLLPMAEKRIYNLQSKQLIKLSAQLFQTNQDEMLEDLEQGDIAETIRVFFEQGKFKPIKKSNLTIHHVESFLQKLSKLTKEEDQMSLLKALAAKCTGNDLKMVVRLIKHDLRINAGPKHILEALHPNAYQAFQASRNLKEVIDRVLKAQEYSSNTDSFKAISSVMTPVLPMLAQACKGINQAFEKCPNGMYAEIKYDGERVQVHKSGNEFSYFSRSLKPVQPHKVKQLKEFIPKAFEFGESLILDSEVLLVDIETQKPLPFGSLGVHKKEDFKDASVCLFVFDCLHYNGENLMDKPISERRNLLKEIMQEIPNHVLLSELNDIQSKSQLKGLIDSVIDQGLEGLVLKDIDSKYEPGKRHWLKVKKDYLNEGAMADSADLVVLGAYFGTGNKGGMMSIFLMGCWNENTQKWCTVTKVHGGHDDATLEKLQEELKMVKISRDADKVPDWLNIKKPLTPDFVCADPKKSQVWEVTGAEFSQAEIHTAAGISIRFPRVTKIRSDKSWKEATSLVELKQLFVNSKRTAEYVGLKRGVKRNMEGSEEGEEQEDDTEVESTPKEKDSSAKKTKMMTKNRDTPEKSKTQRKLDFFVSNSPKGSKTKTSFKDMFPDVFNDLSVYIPNSLEKADILERYFVAYGGQVLKEYELYKSTHILDCIQKQSKNVSEGAVVVRVDWLWNCIKSKKLVPN